MEHVVNPVALFCKKIIDKNKLKKIFKYLPKKPKLYFDVGCGSGRYLQSACEIGLSVKNIYGCEIDTGITKALIKKGFKIYNKPFEKIPLKKIKNKFDIISLFHVIEHLPKPKRTISNIKEILKENGWLVIETPNLESFDAKLFKKTFWGGFHYPRHWHLFSQNPLTILLENNGFKVRKIRYLTGHSFWMYSFHHLLRYKFNAPEIVWRNFDPLQGVMFLSLFTLFDTIRGFLGFKTSSMLILAEKTSIT